jgi:hypothetical protein
MRSGCFTDDAPVFRSCERIYGLRFVGVNPLVTQYADLGDLRTISPLTE